MTGIDKLVIEELVTVELSEETKKRIRSAVLNLRIRNRVVSKSKMISRKTRGVMWCMHWREDDEYCPHCESPDHSPVPMGDNYVGKVWTNDRDSFFRWFFWEMKFGNGEEYEADVFSNIAMTAVHTMHRDDIDYVMATKPWPVWT